MDLRQLQYFQEVCRTGSFTKAAANLYVAQPVITAAIHKLEDEFGIRLLNRTNKSVTLTQEGQVLLKKARILLGLASEITQEMSDFNDLSKGTIRLGMPPQIGNYFLPRHFAKFMAHNPNLNLIVNEESTKATLCQIEQNELDVGIVILPDKLVNLKKRFLLRQAVVLCVAKSHPLSERNTVDLAELKNEKFVMRRAGSIQRDEMIQQCEAHGFSPNIIFSSSQIQTIKTLVARNLGIAFLMKMTVENDSSIHVVELNEPVHVDIGLVWKKNKYVSKALQHFINFITHECTQHERLIGRPNRKCPQ